MLKRKKKTDKAKNYADIIKEINTKKLTVLPKRDPKPVQKTISKREKALMFARNNNKILSKKNQLKENFNLEEDDFKIDNDIININDNLKLLEERHKLYQDKISNNLKYFANS